eukprot:6187329-Pleurochrysis_carterae.AAC.3
MPSRPVTLRSRLHGCFILPSLSSVQRAVSSLPRQQVRSKEGRRVSIDCRLRPSEYRVAKAWKTDGPKSRTISGANRTAHPLIALGSLESKQQGAYASSALSQTARRQEPRPYCRQLRPRIKKRAFIGPSRDEPKAWAEQMEAIK